jgi:hypothetical protein
VGEETIGKKATRLGDFYHCVKPALNEAGGAEGGFEPFLTEFPTLWPPGWDVIALEPGESAAQSLKTNLALNGEQDGVEII